MAEVHLVKPRDFARARAYAVDPPRCENTGKDAARACHIVKTACLE